MVSNHWLIVIGASSGGMEALKTLVKDLPADLPAAILIVWHIPPHSPGMLPHVLSNAGRLPATNARDGEKIQPGHIYVAPPNDHLLVVEGHLRLAHGPKENHFRPAIDPLFRSAAAAYGPHAIGVILSGALDDGTAGLWAIKDQGGRTVIQDPDDALFASMPASALEHVVIDERAPASALGAILTQLVQHRVPEAPADQPNKQLEIENQIAMEENPLEAGILSLGTPSIFTCPSCNGTLLQLNGGGPLRFRCHTGHAFTAETLLADTSEQIEDSLWRVVRIMDENSMMLRQLAQRLKAAGREASAVRMLEQARAVEEQNNTIREIVVQQRLLVEPFGDTPREASS